MFTERVFEYFDTVDCLVERQDKEGLAYFISIRINELISLLNTVFSKKLSDERKEAIMNYILKYSLDYKQVPLDELAADLCTLIGFIEIAECEDKAGGIQDE